MPTARAARAVPWTALVLGAAAALFFARMLVRVDPDVFFHLKEGGRVLSERRLPLVEEYSYTRAGKAMVATEWLSGAAFAAVFRAGGYRALAALNALLLAAALGLMTLVWDEGGPPEALRALILALAAFAFLNFGLAKVQNFTFFFFALFLYWVRLWERGRRWTPWAMAAALVPWVNLHGGFMLGWVLLGGVCGRDFLDSRRIRELAPWALGTFACFVHPNGAAAFVYPIWFFFAAPAGRALILEWRALGPAWSAAPYVLLLAAFLAARPDRLRGRLGDAPRSGARARASAWRERSLFSPRSPPSRPEKRGRWRLWGRSRTSSGRSREPPPNKPRRSIRAAAFSIRMTGAATSSTRSRPGSRSSSTGGWTPIGLCSATTRP
jgi:hypothetical protein